MNRSKKQFPAPVSFDAKLIWAAACAANRINGGYHKFVPQDHATVTATNREIFDGLVVNQEALRPEDFEQGELVRSYYKGLTFKILKGIKLSEFDNTAMVIANRDSLSSRLEFAVIVALPSCYQRSAKRDDADQRIKFASGGYVGTPGDKVKLGIEVLKSVYSQQWATYYITGITESDQPVFFAFKEAMPVGSKVQITGTVKSHRETSTQLNRVRVI